MFNKSKIYFTANGEYVNNKKKNIVETFDFDDSRTYIIVDNNSTDVELRYIKFNNLEETTLVNSNDATKFKEIKVFNQDSKEHFLVPTTDNNLFGILSASNSVRLVQLDVESLFADATNNFSSKLGVESSFLKEMGTATLLVQFSLDNDNTGIEELVNENGQPISIRNFILNKIMEGTTITDMTRENANIIINDYFDSLRLKLIENPVKYPNDSTESRYEIVDNESLMNIREFTYQSRYINLNNVENSNEVIENEVIKNEVIENEVIENSNEVDVFTKVEKCIQTFNGLTLKELDNLPDDLKVQLSPYIAHLQD